MKYSILSFCFNDYDIIREPHAIDCDAEYVYVTDSKKLKSNIWNIKYYCSGNGAVYDSFYVRYHPFEFVNTDVCIILDGSMQINKSLARLYEDFVESNSLLGLTINTWIPDLQHEIDYWLSTFNSSNGNKRFTIDTYHRLNHFIHHWGMSSYKGNICAGVKIVTKHSKNIEFDEIVFEHLKYLGGNTILRLDQPVISVIYEKLFNNIPTFLMCRQIFQNSYITYCKHHSHDVFPPATIDYENIWFRNKRIHPYILT